MSRGRTVIVLVMLILLAVTLTGAFLTRGVMADLPFLQARKGSWTGAYVPLGIVRCCALCLVEASAPRRKKPLRISFERLAATGCWPEGSLRSSSAFGATSTRLDLANHGQRS